MSTQPTPTGWIDTVVTEDEQKIIDLWNKGKSSIMDIACKLNVGILDVTNALAKTGWGNNRKTKKS